MAPRCAPMRRVYWEHLFAPLLHTLEHLTGAGAVVVMAHVRRWAHDARFFKMAAKKLRPGLSSTAVIIFLGVAGHWIEVPDKVQEGNGSSCRARR